MAPTGADRRRLLPANGSARLGRGRPLRDAVHEFPHAIEPPAGTGQAAVAAGHGTAASGVFKTQLQLHIFHNLRIQHDRGGWTSSVQPSKFFKIYLEAKKAQFSDKIGASEADSGAAESCGELLAATYPGTPAAKKKAVRLWHRIAVSPL